MSGYDTGMIIRDYEQGIVDGMARVSAMVFWEESDRPSRRIYMETDASFGDDLVCNPHSWLLGAFVPAMRHEERRIRVEGAICPKLRNGLEAVIQYFRLWYGELHHGPIDIEPTGGFRPGVSSGRGRASSFLSGGVDALTTFRSNRLDFPLDHPYSIKDCFFVHGFDVGGYESLDSNRLNSRHAIEVLSGLASRNGAELIPVFTNLRYLDDSDYLFFTEFYGAALASVAHAFAGRITDVSIASGSSAGDLEPIGSHPLVDLNYSSADLRVHHDGIRYSRLEKVGVLSQWPDGLSSLRACFDAFRDGKRLNCGECEKCLRTMTELLVCGGLKSCPTYPFDDISPELLMGLKAGRPLRVPNDRLSQLKDVYLRLNTANRYYWRELIEPLERIGRGDLAVVIRGKLSEYDRYESAGRRPTLRSRLKHLDDRVFDGMIRRMYRMLPGCCIRGV